MKCKVCREIAVIKYIGTYYCAEHGLKQQKKLDKKYAR